MIYYPQYLEAAVFSSIILLTIYFLKQNYYTTRNRFFLLLAVDNLLAAVIDIITAYTVSFPFQCSIGFNYFINELYYALYNYLAVLFLLYVGAVVKSRNYRKHVGIYAIIVFVIQTLLIFTTHFTHFVFYFDENRIYTHGPGLAILYALAFISIFHANVAIIRYRKELNYYQVISVTGFILVILFSVIIQIFYPKYLITNFTLSMMMFFLYSAFENPAYYLYGDTQCFNRRAFLHTIRRATRKGEQYKIISLKVKDTEYIGSSFGLNAVERISYRIAEQLQNIFNNNIYCYRIYGFAIIEPINADVSETLSKIDNLFKDPIVIDTESATIKQKLSFNIGIINVEDTNISDLEILDLLESATTEENNKEYGSEEVSQLVQNSRRRKKISQILDRAIREDNFEMYYQPIYEIKSGTFKGAEALLRLTDNEIGFVSPDEFIPIAEANGQIIEIGEMVLRKVCKFIRDSELLSLNIQYIDVNLSPIQCRYEKLGEKYLSIIKEYMIDTRSLNLEITETAQTEIITADTLKKMMEYLVTKGVDFSIDDYGSGFATIDYLLEFPASTVKIDKSILWQAMKNHDAMVILEHTIHLLKAIGKKIVVEGVEDIVMRDLLIGIGCDYLQGYLYSKPLPEGEFIKFLHEHNCQNNESEV